MTSDTELPPLYPFHAANIHEQRWAAYVARAIPFSIILSVVILTAVGVFSHVRLLLGLCAFFNVVMWLYICSVAVFGIMGSKEVQRHVLRDRASSPPINRQTSGASSPGGAGSTLVNEGGSASGSGLPSPSGSVDARYGATPNASANFDRAAIAEAADVESQEQVRHIVVLPNYKEDEAMLAETLEGLSQAEGSRDFWVVLAMEEREGQDAEEKVTRLVDRYADRFDNLFGVTHPKNLEQDYLDGTHGPEVPGKASNLRWAVGRAYMKWNARHPTRGTDNVVLTVADADVLFHPSYFSYVKNDFDTMRFDYQHGAPEEVAQHKWTMWQAPQLPFRNYYISPIPSRVWGYVSSLYEFGGVSGISAGGHHMVFSAYSVSLDLAVKAQLWDGDVIAEDHHAFLKAFLYSAHVSASAEKDEGDEGCRPVLRVRPVMLPVKSTSVVSEEGGWQSWVDRWGQAKRHCQGVAELSYILLATWDLMLSVPYGCYNLHFFLHLSKVIIRLFLIHILPVCQAITFGVLSLYWLIRHGDVAGCPNKIWMASADGDTLLCGLAGAWALTWPILIPFFLLAIANIFMIRSSFLLPKTKPEGSGNLWYDCDGGVEEVFMNSKSATVMGLVFIDALIFMGPVMAVYGALAEVLGCWNVMIKGNYFTYVSATKATGAPGASPPRAPPPQAPPTSSPQAPQAGSPQQDEPVSTPLRQAVGGVGGTYGTMPTSPGDATPPTPATSPSGAQPTFSGAVPDAVANNAQGVQESDGAGTGESPTLGV